MEQLLLPDVAVIWNHYWADIEHLGLNASNSELQPCSVGTSMLLSQNVGPEFRRVPAAEFSLHCRCALTVRNTTYWPFNISSLSITWYHLWLFLAISNCDDCILGLTRGAIRTTIFDERWKMQAKQLLGKCCPVVNFDNFVHQPLFHLPINSENVKKPYLKVHEKLAIQKKVHFVSKISNPLT